MSDTDILNYFKDVGVNHNKALDIAFSNIKNRVENVQVLNFVEGSTKMISKGELYPLMIESTILATREIYPEFVVDLDYATDYLMTYNFGHYFGQTNSLYDVRYDDEFQLSPLLNSYIDSAMNIMKSYENTTNVVEIKQQLFSMRDRLLLKLQNENEKMAFVAGMNCYASSFEYWHSNYDEWNRLFEDPNIQKTPSSGKAAFVGAVIGDGVGFLKGVFKGILRGSIFGFQSAAASGLYHGFVSGVAGSIEGAATGAASSWL